MISGMAVTRLALSGFPLAEPGHVPPGATGLCRPTEMYRTMIYYRCGDAEL